MNRNIFGYYLIKNICNLLILSLFKIHGKCVECINKAESVIKSNVNSDNRKLYDEIFQKIEKYVVEEKHFLDKDLSIVVLAHECHIKKELVNKTLQFKSNLTFSDYRKRLRLDYACKLLIDPSNMKIDVVADASGFRNTRTFGRSFVLFYGMSPKDYKRLHECKKELVLLTNR